MNNSLSRNCLTFGIMLLFVMVCITPCMGLKTCKMDNTKNTEMGNINYFIQNNKREIQNMFNQYDFLDQYQILWNKGIAVGSPDLLAQSFKPSENMLNRVELLICKIGTPTDNLSISIRSSLNGTDITSVTVLPQYIPTDKDWVEFDFHGISVEIGQTYYIVFTPQPPGYAYLWWGYDNHNFDSYPNGEAWLYSNGEWSTENFVIKDWCFKTYASHLSNPPYKPNTPAGPTIGMTWNSYSYSTNTTDPDGDDVKYGWDWNGDNIIDEWTGFYPSGMTINTSHSWDTSGTYNTTVKAEDIHGAQSEFSSVLTVIMSNDPPDKPNTPAGPTIGMTRTSYSYSTNTTDPDGDDVKYGWDWNGDDTVDEWTTNFYPSGRIVNISHTWNTSGTYNVRVRAEDINGALSEFSSAKKVVIVAIDNNPPDKPNAPTGPTFAKVGTSCSYSSSAADPDGDNIYYLFDWDDGTNSGWSGPYNSEQTATISHIWNVKGTYQIKVKAKDEYGEESVWSEPLPISMPMNHKSNSSVLHQLFERLTTHSALIGHSLFSL